MTAWWLSPPTTRSFSVSHPRLIPDFAHDLSTPTRSFSVTQSRSLRHAVAAPAMVLVGKVALWEKQSLVAVVRGLEMYEQADLARGRWVHHGSVGVFRSWTSL